MSQNSIIRLLACWRRTISTTFRRANATCASTVSDVRTTGSVISSSGSARSFVNSRFAAGFDIPAAYNVIAEAMIFFIHHHMVANSNNSNIIIITII